MCLFFWVVLHTTAPSHKEGVIVFNFGSQLFLSGKGEKAQMKGVFLFLLPLLFAWARADCTVSSVIPASGTGVIVNSPVGCYAYTLTATDPSRFVMVRIDTGTLEGNGLCQVRTLSGVHIADLKGERTGIVASTEAFGGATVSCSVETLTQVAIWFMAVTRVEKFHIGSVTSSPIGEVMSYTPGSFYQWTADNVNNENPIVVEMIDDNQAFADRTWAFTDNVNQEIFRGSDQITSQVYYGTTITLQLLTQSLATSDNAYKFRVRTDPGCRLDVDFSDFYIAYTPSCETFQYYASSVNSTYYVAGLIPSSSALECDLFFGFDSPTYWTTVGGERLNNDLKQSLGTELLIHCRFSGPFSISRFILRPFVAAPQASCTQTVFVDQFEPFIFNIPSQDGNLLSSVSCKAELDSPYLHNSVTVSADPPHFPTPDSSFFLMTNLMSPSTLIADHMGPEFQLTLASQQGLPIFRFFIVDDAEVPVFDVKFEAHCLDYCLSGVTATDHSLKVGWSDRELVDETILTIHTETVTRIYQWTGLGCFDSLNANTFYNVTFTGKNDDTQVAHFQETVKTAPGPMTAPWVVASSITATSAVVAWNPYSVGDVNIDAYVVQYNALSGIPARDEQVMTDGAITSVEIDSLEPNTRHSVQVRAYTLGTTSRYSRSVEFITGASAHPNLRVESCPTETSIEVAFDDVLNDGEVRTLVRSEICWCYTLDNVFTNNLVPNYVIQNLLPNRRVIAFTKAYYDDGSVVRSPDKILQPVPRAMSNAPTLVETGTDKITVRWERYDEEGDIEITSYILTLINLFHSSEVMTTVSENVFSHTFGGVNPNAEYRVSIKAVAGPCESGPSPMLAVTTDPVPVTTIEQETQTNDTVTLSWEPPSGDGARSVVSYTLISPVGSTQTTGVNATAEGLQSNTLYNFRILTEYDDGTVVESVDFSGGTVPNPPENLVLTPTKTGVIADWSPISDGNLPVPQYRAEIYIVSVVNTAGTTATFNGLLPNSRYRLSVSASNMFGSGVGSEFVLFSTLLPDPVIDGINQGVGSVRVLFSLPSNGNTVPLGSWTLKLVTRGGTEITAQTMVSPYTFMGLEDNTFYAVYATAVFENMEETTAIFSQEALTSPQYGGTATLQGATTSALGISWPPADGDGDITYTVYVDDAEVATSLTVTQYVIDGLMSNTGHMIVIAAVNAVDDSSGMSVTLNTLPDDPQNFAATSVTSTGLILQWEAPTGNAYSVDGYRIEYNGNTWTGQTGVTGTPISGLQAATTYSFELFAEFGGIGATSTTISVCTAPGLAENLQVVGQTSSSVGVTWDPAPSCATIQYYTVGATQVYGTSTSISGAPNTMIPVTVVAVDDGDGSTGGAVSIYATTFPTTPTIQSTTPHITSIDVTMSYPTKNNGGYTFQHYLVSVNGGAESMETSDTFTISGLQGATSYLIFVRAVFDGLAQTFDTSYSEITNPDEVRNIVLSDITPTSVTVEWDPPIGTEQLTNYEVYVNGLIIKTYALSDRRAELVSLQANSIIEIEIYANTLPSFSVAAVQLITDALPISSYTVSTCNSSFVELNWITPRQGMYRPFISSYEVCVPSLPCTTSISSDATFAVASGDEVMVNVTTIYAQGNGERFPFSVESTVGVASEPLQVTNVRVMEGTTNSDIDVYWDLPANGVGIDSYEITYTFGGDVSSTETVIGGDEIFGSVSSLNSNTLYTVSVTAINECNRTESELVEYATPQTPVFAITQSMTTTSGMEITFNAPTQDGTYLQLSRYNVFLNDGFEMEAATSPFSLSGLAPGTSYQLYIQSVFSDVSMFPTIPDSIVNSASVTVTTVCGPPFNPLVTLNEFTWQAPLLGTEITSYEVQCSTDSFATHESYSANNSTFSVNVVFTESNTEYECKVRAVNDGGNGEFSETVSVATDPGPPTVQFSSATSDSITVTIIPNVGGGFRSSPEYTAIAVDEFANEHFSTTHTRLNPIIGGIPTATKYSVRVRTDYGGSITVPDSAPVDMYTLSESMDVDAAMSAHYSVTFGWSEPFNDGLEIDRFEARLDTDVEGTYTTITTSPTTISNLQPNNQYTIYVYAVNPAGRSADGSSYSLITEPFSPVLSVDGSDSSSATVSYTWDGNNGYNGFFATTYDLTVTGGGSIETVSNVNAAMATQTISLASATSYTVELSLSLRSSLQDYLAQSNQVTVTTVPGAVQDMTVSMETESAFVVSWSQPAGGNVIDEYQVMATASTTVSVGNSEQSGFTTDLSITLTDLAPNTQFTITVNAVNSAGIGPDAMGSGTTLPIATDPPTTKEATSDSITVMWSPPVNEAQTPQGYTVMLLNAFGLQIDSVDVSGSMLEATFTVADANTRYNAAVTSSFPNGRSFISKAGPIWSAPDQPNSVRGLSTSTDTITVAFQGVSSGYPCCDVLFYILTMYGPDGNETVEILPNGLSEFVHTFDVSPNTGYTFDVAAFNGHHTGLASPSLFIRSQPPAMEVYVDYTTSDTVGVYWNPLTTGNVDVHAYLVIVSPRFDTDPDSTIATGLSHVISGLEANRQYLVSVQAYTSGGRSPTDDSMLAFATTAPLAPPAPVQSVEYPPTATEITVDFECPQLLGCSPIGDFKLKWTQVSGNGTDGGVTGGSLTGCAGSYTITGLQINTVYAIQVAVANMGNSSDYSEPVEICTNPHVPDPPTARFDLLRQGIVVDWNPPPEGGGADILEYNIAWFSTNDRGEKHVSVVGMNHTTVIRGLLPVTTYRVTVQAFNAHGAGNTSYHTEVTTGSGIVCSETPIISITAEDIASKVNPSTGDQLVISSRDVRNQHTAAELLPQCTNDLTSGDDVHFLFNITDCEPVVEYASDKFDGADNETLVYTFMIQLARQTDFSSVIQRFNPTAMFKFECIFDRTASLTADVIQPYVGKNLMVMDPEHGSFDLDFELYASDAYDTPLVGSPPRVQVLTYINAQIKLDVHSNNFVIQMQHCWATPSNSGNDTRSYPIIVNSCPAENPFDPAGAIIVTRNYQPTTARFRTLAFVWSNMADEDQTMFIHCDVVVCDSDSQDGCTDWNCGTAGRKRRSVLYDRKRRLTYGPIILSNKEQDLCDEDNGGCEDTCMVENGEVACSCEEGRKLNSDRRTCSVEYYTKMLEKSVVPQPILMVVIVALVLLVLWLTFVRKPSEYHILHK